MTETETIALIVLLMVNLTVAATRAGLLNIRYGRLINLGEQGALDVQPTVALVTRRARLRATLKLTQILLRFSMAAILLNLLEPWRAEEITGALILATMLGSALALWLLEFVAERVILRDPETWAVRFTPVGRLLVTLMSPFLAIPMRLSDSANNRNLVTITEDELKSLVEAGQAAGVLEADESQMIQNVFELGETVAREIMVPRVDMLMLDVHTPLEQATDVLLESGFSRVPVYENSSENIIGLLYTKDMLKAWRAGNGIRSLHELLRPVNFIPETKKLDELLDEMQAERYHIAVIVDEYGGISGLVTLEDIVEEIFGEIQDEYDDEEVEMAQEVAPDEFLFHGGIDLEEVNDLMHSHLPTDEADTLGGLIYRLVGRVPRKGERLEVDGLSLTVEQLSDRRIRAVRAKRLVAVSQSPENEE